MGLGPRREFLLESDCGRTSTSQALGICIQYAMDVEKTIDEIELLERLYSLPDRRPMTLADRTAANRRHDETLAENPWFRLWKRYGI
jgi:hypothetical protein